MSPADSLRDVAIVGRSCRLPGAQSVDALWQLLAEGRCAVTSIPAERWPLERHWHPRLAERGRTYTWAAGILDDIWGFDAGAFGISPREAEQMDPQQRLLLELTWEALEDAGIAPSTLAGSDAGVFVGASSVDHANPRLVDMAAADAYMMTGNTLSIIANRISYIFDLRGPSFTLDTACSSSLVAVNEALVNLRSGRIDTAIVAGVSLLVAPQAFVGFSQAAMLSRRGLCQAFSAHADGYVRAEGGIVLVLKTLVSAARDGNPVHGLIVDADINSDGRTNGISLPSERAQAQLLERLYRAKGLDPASIAFIEAHGTGTPVGDPIEASAIGKTLGCRRDVPLPIGSIKTNIGHMEAAAGLGGVLKAMLALEHDQLPASLHSEELNPAIDFAAHNLEVVQSLTPLGRSGRERRLAGVNAFGFGGTNAHVILTDAPPPPPAADLAMPPYLVISAHSRTALAALATNYADRLRRSDNATALVVAMNHRRDRLAHRIVLPLEGRRNPAETLEAIGESRELPDAFVGTASKGANTVAFVFSGNGSQFAGMGLSAYRHSAFFRTRLDEISYAFAALAGWSIVDALHAEDLADRLASTRFAQPLLFAIQSATCRTLRHYGLEPALVLGHSVGEVAAAEAAGLLDQSAVLRTIHARSLHQELACERGGMAVLIGSREASAEAVAELPGLEIAAFNSPRTLTVSGTNDHIDRLADVARRHKVRSLKLELAYPFHSAGMAPVEAPLMRDLAEVPYGDASVPFLSTVTGDILAAGDMDARYWWRNVREPVRFSDAVTVAVDRGVVVFVEIGPAPTLISHIRDTIGDRAASLVTLAALDRRDRGVDPLAMTVAEAFARGAMIDEGRVLGPAPGQGCAVALPSYPWQRQPYRLAETSKISKTRPVVWHPLIGTRADSDRLEWQSSLDTATHPWLGDHRVDGRPILPGTAFAEMAIAVARDWLGIDEVTVCDLEIVAPMLVGEVTCDVLCRVSSMGGQLEILSRHRLSASPWQTHATAKIVREPSIRTPSRLDEKPTSPSHAISGLEVYEAAENAGLQLGPAFRKLEAAAFARPNGIVVALNDDDALPGFAIDPARLDSCFHGLVLLFADRHDVVGPGTAPPSVYVPVRFGEIALHRGDVRFTKAQIDVSRHDSQAIVADITITDARDEIVVILRDARFQPMRTARDRDAVTRIIRRTVVLAPEPTAGRRDRPLSLDTFRKGIIKTDTDAPLSDHFILLEGWATALALQTARALADADLVDVTALIANGRVSERMRPWLQHLLVALERSGLCLDTGFGYRLVPDAVLPSPDEIVRIIARDHPELATELHAAAAAQAALQTMIAGGVPAAFDRVFRDFEACAQQLRLPAVCMAGILRRSASSWPRDRAMHILQVGHGPLTPFVATIVAATQARLSIFEPDRLRPEQNGLTFTARSDFDFIDKVENLPTAAFDLVIAAQGGVPTTLRRTMAPGAILVLLEPPDSLFHNLIVGLDACLRPEATVSLWTKGRKDWRRTIDTMGLAGREIDEIATCIGAAQLLTAQVRGDRRYRERTSGVLIIGAVFGRTLQTACASLLASSGLHVTIVLDTEGPPTEPADTLSEIILFVHAGPSKAHVELLRDQCLRLKHLAAWTAGQPARLWLVTFGGTACADDLTAALWAFSRTLANEVTTLDIRRVDVPDDIDSEHLAERLHDLVLSETDETEIVIDRDATRVVRFVAEDVDTFGKGPRAEAAQLRRDGGTGIDRLRWKAASRRPPENGEVEIAVEAAGLNFRDVMFSLGLLPDEILEHGFAGPTLGLECAGRVTRVGTGAGVLKPDDRVMCFARHALATHVVVPAFIAAPIPEGLSFEAAATIPVAFLTAYYALVTCAQLKPNEWVLVHGGAGGVGLAALQIARWRGARVIATAGSPGKRALLLSLGAEHAFDSRSGSFVEDVRHVTDDGVAVVLNSLAGEAMERSIACLRPFGRFVELGKRDYVANTHIGLRPFRRNLSYFGVDLDQLLIANPAVSRHLMRSVIRLFSRGLLVPLPYRGFAASEAVDAFRLMQRSGHVGKLVLRPPEPSAMPVRVADRIFQASADRMHLVTGGLGGFGLATASWLAAAGARHIMLVGRSGGTDATARRAITDLAARGVRVVVEACDVADQPAMKALLARFGTELPKLAGVVHAAMVLEDGLIANLTADQVERVFRPKIVGADLLDQLTRGMALDYFVLYGSATTLIGNPGQATYVAANGYLEGLARRRRREGLPALTVAWGAISDVGVIARSAVTREHLESRVGVKTMKAAVALDCLGKVLAAASDAPEDAVVVIAPISWSKARRHLKILGSPTYDGLVGRDDVIADRIDTIDIPALVAGGTPEAARKAVADLVVEEIARVLRLPGQDIARATPLSEAGLDSLMAVELALGLERRFARRATLSASASSFSVNELADQIIAAATAMPSSDTTIARLMMERHDAPSVGADDPDRLVASS